MIATEVVRSRVCASHCQTRQPVTADWKVSCPIQESAGASTAKKSRARQFTAVHDCTVDGRKFCASAHKLQADLQPADRVQGPGETRVGTPSAHLLSSANFSKFQSAYRKGHSTETALQEVLDKVFTAADDKQVTVLIRLDLSAAFNTCRLLLDCLRLEFGVMEIPLRWLQSYLEGRTQFIKMGQHESHATEVDVGVWQGSVLGPLLFAVYCRLPTTSPGGG